MAATNAQQNILDAMQRVAIQQLQLRQDMLTIVVMYVNEGIASMLEADVQALATFAGVTITELVAAKGAMDALVTSLGDLVPGTNAYKLLKIANNVP